MPIYSNDAQPPPARSQPPMVALTMVAAADGYDSPGKHPTHHKQQQQQREQEYNRHGRRHVRKRDIIEVVAAESEPDDWPICRPMIFDLVRWLSLVVSVAWGLVLWAGWIMKYFLEDPGHFGHYLTNWSWVLQTLTFTLISIALIFRWDRLLWLVYYAVWWPVWVSSWAVLWLVILVLADSPGLVTDVFEQFGAGTVLAVDRLYHVVTTVMMTVYMFLSLKDHFSFWHLKTKSVWVLILAQFILCHLIVLTYLALNNIRSVYQLNHVYWWTMFLCYEPVVLVFGILIMFVCSEFRRIGGMDFSAR